MAAVNEVNLNNSSLDFIHFAQKQKNKKTKAETWKSRREQRERSQRWAQLQTWRGLLPCLRRQRLCPR